MISTVSERTFPYRVPPYVGKKTVRIITFGKRLNGQDGAQGSITGEYTHDELWTYTKNTLAHTDFYQSTGIRFNFPDATCIYLSLPFRASQQPGA